MIAFLLTLYLVSAPDAPWTSGRAAAATAEAEAALAWWSLRTGGAAPTLSAPVFIETPTPYDRTTYMRTDAPGLYIVARVAGGPTLPNGRSGWARPNGFRLVVLETPARVDATLAALVAHEWGHAAYGLPDTEARGDIMGPDYPQAYAQGRVGCESLRVLGGGCVWLPVAQNEAPHRSEGRKSRNNPVALRSVTPCLPAFASPRKAAALGLPAVEHPPSRGLNKGLRPVVSYPADSHSSDTKLFYDVFAWPVKGAWV